MRTHGHHWFDLARMDLEPHPSPIRRVPSLSNIYDARSEGIATAMEEMMMHAGLFDDHPRSLARTPPPSSNIGAEGGPLMLKSTWIALLVLSLALLGFATGAAQK